MTFEIAYIYDLFFDFFFTKWYGICINNVKYINKKKKKKKNFMLFDHSLQRHVCLYEIGLLEILGNCISIKW